jgi:hypothetical protein
MRVGLPAMGAHCVFAPDTKLAKAAVIVRAAVSTVHQSHLATAMIDNRR